MSRSHLDRANEFGVVHFKKQPHSDPANVVNDPEMSTQEKRELLADWASDRRAVTDRPALRRLDTGELVDIDAVLDALKRLDGIEPDGHGPRSAIVTLLDIVFLGQFGVTMMTTIHRPARLPQSLGSQLPCLIQRLA